MSRRRRNRVDEPVALALAVLAGAGAWFSPPAPTGDALADHALLAASILAVTFAGASASRRLVLLAPVAAAIVAFHPVLVLLAALALGAAVHVAMRRRSMSAWRAGAIGLALNVLARAELELVFGLTSAVGIAVGAAIFVAGMRRRPRMLRRRLGLATGAVAAAAVLTVLGFGVSAAKARGWIDTAGDRIDAGVAAIDDGDFSTAAAEFAAASTALREAEERLANPLAVGAPYVPVLAQHRSLAVGLSDRGADLTSRIADSLATVDLPSLMQPGGIVDLDGIAALDGTFADIAAALDELEDVVQTETESDWLLGSLRTELAGVTAEIDDAQPRVDQVRTILGELPEVLGVDGARRYVVLFTTPAEARGLGGFPGNYAELTVDRGRIEMTDFGRVNKLERRATTAGARLTGMPGFLNRYGPFGFNRDGRGLVGDAVIRNLTMTPQMPTVGEAMAQLYPQATGREIDGVLVVDPFVLAALLEYSGPIELTETNFTLTAENAVDYLLIGQYLTDDHGERVDALDEAGHATFDALLGQTLPDPAELADRLGPLVAERRLLLWTADRDQHDLLRSYGLLGELPVARGANGWAFTVNNDSPSKIDTFLARSASYETTVDPATGTTVGTLRVALTNHAPPDGLPDYLIGNAFGLPQGTSRLYVSFYSTMLLTSGTSDGAPAFLTGTWEQGWNVYSQFVTIPPGASVSYELRFEGTPIDPTEVVTWTQPLASPVQPLGAE